jgi:glycosyltransferase involved in cell wall biosynthesis|tara:strand:+ start:250 stop:1131 length:882 start_codon:yes stop_codon:yes gene_type:complete
MNLVICIPAFNEERTIGDIVKRAMKYSSEVIVCDDGSSDNTAEEAKKSGAYVIEHETNQGKGSALKTLFANALEKNAEIVVTIDGDGQFLPEEISKIIKPISEKNADLVIGYRFEAKNKIPSYRKFGNKILDKMTSTASGLSFRDTQSGFRAYSQKALKLINFSTNGFGADSEILINLSKKGLKIVEEKITVIYDTGGKTSTKNPISHSVGVTASIIELIVIRRPLLFVGLPGLILTIIGIVFTLSVISIFNDSRYFSIPYTLVSMGTFLLGMMLVLVSVVLFSISKAIRNVK